MVRRGHGLSDLEQSIEAGPRTNYRLASITKQFTCALLLDRFPDPSVLDADVAAALPGLSFAAFGLAAGPAGFFPNAKKPRVFWLGLSQGADECAALAGRVDALCAGLGFAR